MQSGRYDIKKLKNLILKKLSDPQAVDQCVLERMSIRQRNINNTPNIPDMRLIKMSECIHEDAFLANGAINTTIVGRDSSDEKKRIIIDMNRVQGRLLSLKEKSGIDFFNLLSDQEKIAFDAVLFSIETQLGLEKQMELEQNLTNINNEISSLEEQKQKDLGKIKALTIRKKQMEKIVKTSSTVEALSAKIEEAKTSIEQATQNIKIEDIRSALNSKALLEFMAYLKADFNTQDDNRHLDPAEKYSHFFNKLSVPSYLMPLIEEAIDIIKTITENTTFEQIQQKINSWFHHILSQSLNDLFDDERNIRKDLYDLLPEYLHAGLDPETEKKLLFTAYLTHIGQLLADMAQIECPDQANIMIKGKSFETPTITIMTEFLINNYAKKINESKSFVEAISSSEKEIALLLPHFYQISHAAQVQRWQEALHTRDVINKKAEEIKTSLTKDIQTDWRQGITGGFTEKRKTNDALYMNVIKPKLEKDIEQLALSQAKQKLQNKRKIEKANVTMTLIKNIKELIIENAKKDAWTYKPAAFFAGETIYYKDKDSEELTTFVVPKNIAAIYNLCSKAEKKEINMDAQEILDIYKDIEIIGAKANRSFFAPLKAQTKEFYEKLDRSHQERIAHKVRKGKKIS